MKFLLRCLTIAIIDYADMVKHIERNFILSLKLQSVSLRFI